MRASRIALLWLLSAPLFAVCGNVAFAADAEEAQYNVVVALYNAGQWQAAVAKIEEREKLNLTDAMRSKYTYAKGLAYEKGTKTSEAATAYQALIEKYPQSTESQTARLALVYLDYTAANYDRLIKTAGALDQARLTAAEKKNVALMTAESLYHKKQDQAALTAYQTAISLGADAATVGGKMFEMRLRLGLHAEVLAQSAQAITGVAADSLALARAEALLALSRYAEVDGEAIKVPAGSGLYPRASLARAQALVKQGKLKEAVEPLEIAIAKLKDPPAPTAAHLALVECLLESNKQAEVEQVLAKADARIAALPEAERAPLLKQVALLRLRAAGDDPHRIGAAFEQARPHLTPDQLSKALYKRLFALASKKEYAALLKTMAADYLAMRGTTEHGPAALVYYRALTATDRGEEAVKLLVDFVQAAPAGPEAAKARLALAQVAASKSDYALAKTHLDAALAVAGIQEALGKQAWTEAMYNRAVTLEKLGDHAQSLADLKTVLAAAPSAEIERESLVLLGQISATTKDYAGAVAAWKTALAKVARDRQPDLHDRLARVLLATGDHTGVIEQYTAAVKTAGGEQKLDREAREAFARSLFTVGKFTDAAGVYQRLAAQFPKQPALAYETAIALERAGNAAKAAMWYEVAERGRSQLPPEYATALAQRLARIRLESGAGDMGVAFWLKQVAAPGKPEAIEQALDALRKIAIAGKIDSEVQQQLRELFDAQPPEQPRRYALGGILLAGMPSGARAGQERLKLGGTLARELSQHEGKLDPKSSGATIGAAMIYFFLAEAQRTEELYPEAMASYETVLAAYPYNHWPDAASCGAAECFVELGDTATAQDRFREVAESKSDEPASKPWKELARKRLKDLERGK